MGIFSFALGFGAAYILQSPKGKLYTGGIMKFIQMMSQTTRIYRPMDDYKMVLIVRTDLNMSKGKIASQCAHASLLNYKQALSNMPSCVKDWERQGQSKVVLRTTNEKSLLDLYTTAEKKRLCANIVFDAGRTEVASGTKTVLAIGPGPKSEIDFVTSHLKTL